MDGEVLIKVSPHTLKLLSEAHDKMRAKNPSMVRQDYLYVIHRLAEEYTANGN